MNDLQIAGLVQECLSLINRSNYHYVQRVHRSELAERYETSLVLVDRVMMLLQQNYPVEEVREIAAVALLQERMLRRAPDNRQFWDTVYAVQARHAPPLAEEEYP